MRRPKTRENADYYKPPNLGVGDDFLAAEILSRLPVRAAARCATLSKRFHRLLTTTTHFWLRRGRSRLGPRPHVACFLRHHGDGRATPPFHAFDFLGPAALAVKRVVMSQPPALYDYAGTCNGLVLLSAGRHRRHIDGLLFNPATGGEATIRLSLPPASGVITSRRRFFGLGYGAKSKAYKALVCVGRDEDGGKLMVISFRDQNEKPRTVLFLPGESLHCHACLYMEDEDGKGKIHLLADIGGNGGKPSAVLAFDVDDEAISTIALPPGEHVQSRLMEIRGRLCICMRDAGKQNILLWALSSGSGAYQWEQLCVLADKRTASAPWTKALHGAWDCGGILFALFGGSIACMYDLRELATGTAGVTPRTWRIAIRPPESVKGLPRNLSIEFLWGYQPTLLCPEGIFGDSGGGALRHIRRSGRRSGSVAAEARHDLPGITDVLAEMMEKLPDGIQDLIAPDQPKKPNVV